MSRKHIHSKGRSSNICSATDDGSGAPDSFDNIVQDYLHQTQTIAEENDRFFRELSLDSALEFAALSKRPDGKRESHQSRISGKALAESYAALSAAQLNKPESFHELLEFVDRSIRDIPGIGELTVYDTAQRIAAHFGLEPDYIYLHAGVRKGAAILGLGRGRAFLKVEELPSAFHVLKAGELENLLCIYAERIAAIVAAENSK